ncbi:hypothetical protein LR48_Vigan07g196400 [Vigna angularis]|uniref:Uncharacterized protein n=1 Tax=Phaseolus angularis TaxID=3914 RepID=A0A0L9UZG3_PHAAN|nr:hypothetical protein LR48_Vigan07g196400 [Vigna angularis]
MGQSQFGQAVEQFDRLPQQQWQQQQFLSERMAKMDDTLQQLMQMSDSHHKCNQAAFRGIRSQLGRKIQKLDDLGSNTKANPREECQAIITRSDKVLDERKEERLSEKEKDVKEEEEKEERKSEVERKEKGKNVEEERKETEEDVAMMRMMNDNIY